MLAIAVLLAVLGALGITIWLIARADRPAQSVSADTPDMPRPFGPGMAWLAVTSESSADVARALAITGCRVANWEAGTAAVLDEKTSDKTIFVTPPVDGWVLVAGLSLPQPLGGGFADKCTPLVASLSERFGEAQYFLAYPQLDYFSWIRAVDGRVRRAFATGDEGLIWNRGNQTGAEKALGLKFFELRGVNDREGDAGGALNLAPTEVQVLALAASWSVDPSGLDGRSADTPATGFLGTAPASWKPERAMKVAA